MKELDTVAVIGGLGRMGAVTVRLFQEAGYPVIISDIKDAATLSPTEAIRKAGIVFFSVLPIESIGDIIRSTKDTFNPTQLVLDNASLKNSLQEGYEMLDQKGISICSTHPLCKEDQPFYGQNVVIAPFGQNSEQATLLAEQVHQKAGMVLIRMCFDKHDQIMLYNQLLPHLINRVIGHTLRISEVDVSALLKIATANSQLFSLAIWRTLVQPPEISAMLIENSLKTSAGQDVVKTVRDSIDTIEQEEDLAKIFRDDVADLDPTGEIKRRMNEASVIALQHMANLAKSSIVLETHEKDRPGLLYELLGVIASHKINLNTVLSEVTKDSFRFHLGIESGNFTPEAIKEISNLGFAIL